MVDEKSLEQKILDRFLRYVRMDTASDKTGRERPSTQKQLRLINELRGELESMGIPVVTVIPEGILVARLASTVEHEVPVIGFMAHVDTAGDEPGANVNPQVHQNYHGGEIRLEGELSLDPREYPELRKYVGQTIITTEGTTLLGADDKAGVAEIMSAAETLQSHPDIPHGEIELFFNTDEEVGMGVDGFPMDQVHSKYCYTLDGDGEGTIETECFNAYTLEVTIRGRVFHPGYAREKLINASEIAARLVSLIPGEQTPQATDERQGYYLVTDINANMGTGHVTFNIRDFDDARARRRIDAIRDAARSLEALYPGCTVSISAVKRYSNMRPFIEGHSQVLEYLEEAIVAAGAQPSHKVIRGGTDGSRLSEMGIPTPNVFDGGYNYHSRLEWAALPSMRKAAQTVIHLARIWAERSR